MYHFKEFSSCREPSDLLTSGPRPPIISSLESTKIQECWNLRKTAGCRNAGCIFSVVPVVSFGALQELYSIISFCLHSTRVSTCNMTINQLHTLALEVVHASQAPHRGKINRYGQDHLTILTEVFCIFRVFFGLDLTVFPGKAWKSLTSSILFHLFSCIKKKRHIVHRAGTSTQSQRPSRCCRSPHVS